jgi:heat shock protein HslJ
MLISAKECDKNKEQLASQNNLEATTTELSERKMQEKMKINYRAATRGFYLEIWIEGDSIKYTSDYNLKAISTHQIPTEEKESLMSLIGDFDEKTLPEIEAPSTRFQFDGAAMATLEINNSEGSYKTVTFDHGNSPKSISLIVEKILSIKTMLEKQ